MIKETTYNKGELRPGVCSCCNEQSDEILIGDTKCIDCIEMIEFENETRKAIDMGGGCSRCGDLYGFECICDDDEDW